MLGLLGCGASSPRLPSPPAEVIRVEIPQYRDLPDYCFPRLVAPSIERGASNEDLIRAYAEALAAVQAANEVLKGCAGLARGAADGSESAADLPR